jgi:nicotinamidase-related amidase
MQTIWGKQVYESLDELVDPAHTAVVVVDMQNDFCHPDGYYGKLGIDMADIEAAVLAMARVVDAARDADVPVIWIMQTLLEHALADSPSWLRRRTRGTLAPEWTLAGGWGQQITAPLEPQPGEPIVEKHRSSAFVGTALDLILRSQRIETCVIGGVVTQGCVESTARDATFHDYYVVMVRDCVATIDRKLHEASMLCQSTRYDFAGADDVVGRWARATSALAAAGR